MHTDEDVCSHTLQVNLIFIELLYLASKMSGLQSTLDVRSCDMLI